MQKENTSKSPGFRYDYSSALRKILNTISLSAPLREMERQTGIARKTIKRILDASQSDATLADIIAEYTVSGTLKEHRPDSAELMLKKLKAVPDQAEKPAEKQKKKPIRINSIKEIDAGFAKGQIHYAIAIAAQDDTPVHQQLISNIFYLSQMFRAPIFASGFTYQKGLFEDHNQATATYDPAIADLIISERIHLSESMMILSDANVLPTSANPLNGWQTANRGQSVIVPHARVALESIPRMNGSPARYALTTGCVTEPNYTPRAAGRKSIFHHTFGFVFIAIDADGTTYPHQVVANEQGDFQLLDIKFENGIVSRGNRILGAVWGDAHTAQADRKIYRASFGYDPILKQSVRCENILDRLQPEHQFWHDINDFRDRNHHSYFDPHERARVLANSDGSVVRELKDAVLLANLTQRTWSISHIIESNHDSALAKWLKNPDGMMDPINAESWHTLNSIWHAGIRKRKPDFNIVEVAMRKCGMDKSVKFTASGKSLVIGGVEHGLHGDFGIGGSKGTPKQFRRFGSKTSSAHTHSPFIIDGCYVAGVSASLRQGYNERGATTWAHAHILLYPNGKRQLLLLEEDGRYMPEGFYEVEMPDCQQWAA